MIHLRTHLQPLKEKHLNEFIKHLFGEVRNEDLSDGIFLDMIEGLQKQESTSTTTSPYI